MSHKLILSGLLLLASTGLVLAEGGFIELRLGQLRQIMQLTDAHVGEFPNGTAGLSMGIVSCNMGTVDIPWWSIYGDADRSPDEECPNDPPDGMSGCHPSMGMEIYRLRDGRLDQIGISWLFHEWYALSSSQCTQCVNGDPSGNHLGVGCSDSHSAANNGSRGDLGPRSEWNPHTNEWEPCGSHFDGPNNDCKRTSHSHGPIDHRLRVADADLYAPNNPGAEYFYQAVYYVKDDALLGNNIGWQPIDGVGWTGNKWFFETSHPNAPTYGPVIRMWDPEAVELDTAEGLAYAGAQVTRLYENTWHYEYAVYNYTSNIPFTSFSVPLPNDAEVTEVGFHGIVDPEEPWNQEDWTITVTDNGITWAGEPYDENPSANALRFGTQYNFSFTADVRPVPGQAALGLFLPGPPEEILADLEVPKSVAALSLLHGNPNWKRNDPQTWFSFNEWAFGGYIDPKIESDNGADVNLGLSTFNAVFNSEPFGDAFGGPVIVGNVAVEVTGGSTPNVTSVVKNGSTVAIELDQVITPREWTTLVFDVYDADGVRIVDNGDEGEGVNETARLDIGFLPGDINNNSRTQPQDLSRWISSWNDGIAILPVDVTNGHPDDYLDISRGGGTQPQDLSRMIQALGGAGNFTRVWNGAGMNSPRP